MKPFVIGVCGGSCSGKSTFVRELTKHLSPESLILAQDNYYKDFSSLSLHQKENLNFDDPSNIDFDEMTTHLNHLIAGNSIEQPQYDFKLHQRKTEIRLSSPTPFIFVEGLHVLARESLRDRLDLSFYLFETRRERLNRRLTRDTQERGRTIESIEKQWKEQVEPMFEKFVLPQEKWADFALHQSDTKKPENLDFALKKIQEAHMGRNK